MGELLDDETKLAKYSKGKEITLEQVTEKENPDHMNILELDHFSRLFDRCFEMFRRDREPNPEVHITMINA
jgi:hypothetical protein